LPQGLRIIVECSDATWTEHMGSLESRSSLLPPSQSRINGCQFQLGVAVLRRQLDRVQEVSQRLFPAFLARQVASIAKLRQCVLAFELDGVEIMLLGLHVTPRIRQQNREVEVCLPILWVDFERASIVLLGLGAAQLAIQ